jgi:DNA-binding NtrC family response regulator
MRPIILVLDADSALQLQSWEKLKVAGFEPIVIGSATDGLRSMQLPRPLAFLVFAPNRSPEEGLQSALTIREANRDVPVILLVGKGSERLAVTAFRAGIHDYFHLPLETEALLEALKRLAIQSSGEMPDAEKETARSTQDVVLIGASSCMLRLKSSLDRIALSHSNVLITGETGTGKELAAAAIHRLSPRKLKPFVCVNCAAIPEALVESELFGFERGAFTGAHTKTYGCLESAEGGTVFLDEIGDMSPFVQAKLLRVIENKEFRRLGGKSSTKVNVRFIAATNRNLEELTAEGKFRQDLYYRLNIVRVLVPPLRDRKEDIPLLLRHYIQEFSRYGGSNDIELTDEVWKQLMAYDWPGNIRELKNLLEATFVNVPNGAVDLADLPESFRQRLQDAAASGASERSQLLAALLCTKWNKSKAAEKLHWSRMTLYRKMAKYHISLPT